jgi:hypothetical protein
VLWTDQPKAALILKQMRELGMKQRVFGSHLLGASSRPDTRRSTTRPRTISRRWPMTKCKSCYGLSAPPGSTAR